MTTTELDELLTVLKKHNVKAYAAEGLQLAFQPDEDEDDEGCEETEVIGFQTDPNAVGADGLTAQEQEELYGENLDARAPR